LTLITIREFGTLTTLAGVSSLDRATIPALDFDWLAQLTSTDGTQSRLLRMDGPRALKVQNYVGVIRTPTGLDIEVLPKRCDKAEDPRAIRRLLLRLIAASHGIPPQVADVADIQILDQPFTEWMALTFVRLAADVVRRGLRRDYLRVEGRERYLRGQLDLPRQLRAGPAAALDFHVRHDVFSFDGPENRLIRAAVDRVARGTRVALTWRLARELAMLLAEIPASGTIQIDLGRWRVDRLMAHYAPIRGLCELILTGRTPFAVAGEQAAESMLFPMERLFEDCVERAIRKRLPSGYTFRRQPKSHTLCRYAGRDWFDLRPDFVVRGGGRAWILDAKWKLLNSDVRSRFGVSQADLYQLNAYGQTYLGGDGDLFLVYPRTPDFPDISTAFEMDPGLLVHVLPIDLETGALDLGTMLSAR
jgi:5-methylcytosine-specific restriction enzyme subunit McrC